MKLESWMCLVVLLLNLKGGNSFFQPSEQPLGLETKAHIEVASTLSTKEENKIFLS